jgi:hypothetical protein
MTNRKIPTWIIVLIFAICVGSARSYADQLTFNLDIASASLGASLTARDILLPGPVLFKSGTSLGLQPGDSMGDFSFGTDPITTPLFFTVDRVAVGEAGSAVAKLSAPAGGGGANGYVFESQPPANSNSVFRSAAQLRLNGGLFGDDIHGLNLQKERLQDNTFFTLEMGSPTLAAGGLSAADIFINDTSHVFATYSQMGLQAGDQISGLVLLDKGRHGQLDPGIDTALFTIGSFSPDATTMGGTLSPASVYETTFNGSFFTSNFYFQLGLRRDDQINAIATLPTPEPGTLLLIITGATGLLAGRKKKAV